MVAAGSAQRDAAFEAYYGDDWKSVTQALLSEAGGEDSIVSTFQGHTQAGSAALQTKTNGQDGEAPAHPDTSMTYDLTIVPNLIDLEELQVLLAAHPGLTLQFDAMPAEGAEHDGGQHSKMMQLTIRSEGALHESRHLAKTMTPMHVSPVLRASLLGTRAAEQHRRLTGAVDATEEDRQLLENWVRPGLLLSHCAAAGAEVTSDVMVVVDVVIKSDGESWEMHATMAPVLSTAVLFHGSVDLEHAAPLREDGGSDGLPSAGRSLLEYNFEESERMTMGFNYANGAVQQSEIALTASSGGGSLTAKCKDCYATGTLTMSMNMQISGTMSLSGSTTLSVAFDGTINGVATAEGTLAAGANNGVSVAIPETPSTLGSISIDATVTTLTITMAGQMVGELSATGETNLGIIYGNKLDVTASATLTTDMSGARPTVSFNPTFTPYSGNGLVSGSIIPWEQDVVVTMGATLTMTVFDIGMTVAPYGTQTMTLPANPDARRLRSDGARALTESCAAVNLEGGVNVASDAISVDFGLLSANILPAISFATPAYSAAASSGVCITDTAPTPAAPAGGAGDDGDASDSSGGSKMGVGIVVGFLLCSVVVAGLWGGYTYMVRKDPNSVLKQHAAKVWSLDSASASPSSTLSTSPKQVMPAPQAEAADAVAAEPQTA
jgi:hypothetical protein